jgi:hypothetical protein
MFKASILASLLALLPNVSFAASCGSFEDQSKAAGEFANQCIGKATRGTIPGLTQNDFDSAASFTTLEKGEGIYVEYRSADDATTVAVVAQCDPKTGKMVLHVVKGTTPGNSYLISGTILDLESCEPGN